MGNTRDLHPASSLSPSLHSAWLQYTQGVQVSTKDAKVSTQDKSKHMPPQIFPIKHL